MSDITNLEPKALWKRFDDFNKIPRPSKREEKAVEYVKSMGNKMQLETIVDSFGNVIIKKPATPGMENRKPVILQGHVDMVCQKNADTEFNFDTDAIQTEIDGDWVHAIGTTLGADNGIGVAAALAILESTDIPHPAIEALFTIDEETGMTGAIGLKAGMLHGDILLNLDTEDDDEFTIGCAGGVDVTATGSYATTPLPTNHTCYQIKVTGLTGGHSGMDIHRGRSNANKLMNRILINALNKFAIVIGSVDGGSLRNAIPRESVALVATENSRMVDFKNFLTSIETELKNEYRSTDSGLRIELTTTAQFSTCVETTFSKNLMRAIYTCPIGIYRMSPEVEGLVQTSNNLARILISDGNYSIQCLTRSSVDSEKMDMADAIAAAFELVGAKVTMGGSYPGWAPKPEAGIIKTMDKIYRELFNESPKVSACHAGLECGILGTHYPKMEMISFGPNIRGAHSPDEKVQISSTEKFWKLLLATLANIPEKN